MIGRWAQRFATAIERPHVAYALALSGVGVSAAVRGLAGLLIESPPNYMLFYPAILFAAFVAGVSGGLLAVVASTLTIWAVWLPQAGPLTFVSQEHTPLIVFVLTAATTVLIAKGLGVAVRRGVVAEERLRVATEASQDGFVILEPVRADGRIIDFAWVYANPAADGMSPGGRALVGRRVRSVFPDETGVSMVSRLAALLGGGGPDDLEVRRSVDGRERWMRSAGVRLRDSVAVTFRDVTEIVEARRDLEERVAERTRELEASLEERARTEAALAQAQRLETVGRLTGGVAHDFNNLLTVVIGGLDMILRAPDDAKRVKRLAEAALSAGQRGERLTRQLLAFSRHQELKLEVVEVAGLIRQIEPLIRHAVGEARDLVVQCAPDAGASRLDAAQFEAALLNLVVNAADATDAGGRIVVSATRTVLAPGEVQGAAAGEYVRVAVTDSGSGMSPEVLARVFEPFFTTKEVGKGTGLGLAQVYGFVSQCGGAVAIESAPGAGTTVALHLPAAEAAAEPPAEVPANLAAAVRGARVLLVEDDEGVRTIAQGLLTELGCTVETAIDGASALAKIETDQAFDLLISDIVMPGGMSGVDLAQAAQAKRPALPIILMTGYGGRDLARAGADLEWPILRKPFHAEQLAAALRDALPAPVDG